MPLRMPVPRAGKIKYMFSAITRLILLDQSCKFRSKTAIFKKKTLILFSHRLELVQCRGCCCCFLICLPVLGLGICDHVSMIWFTLSVSIACVAFSETGTSNRVLCPKPAECSRDAGHNAGEWTESGIWDNGSWHLHCEKSAFFISC